MINTSSNHLKNWTYILQDIVSDNIIIWKSESVTIIDFDYKSTVSKIELSENANLEFYWLYRDSWSYGVDIVCKWKNSKATIKILNLSKNSEINLTALARLNWDNNFSDIHVISFCWEDGKIKINSWINISKNTIGCTWNILQENIFVWENGKIIWIPALDIETSEAKANHALKIEKINPKDLFYLESRWIDKKTATRLIFESKISSLFTKIFKGYWEQIDEYTNDFLK